ncbi:hypothetical protein NK936_23770, partial [Salmonella enterica subsp. enterica serovar Typhimurium]|uniref:hypothetical protein n=1 Tax=Salmonella enterica TaxID=28901 RepID=UPI0020A5C2C8
MNDDVVRVARESLGAREFAPSMAVDRFTAAVLADVKMDRQQEGRASDAARVASASGSASPGLGARRGELRTLRGATLEELS